MADAAGYGGLLAALDWAYWVVAALAIWWVWRKPSTRRGKILYASIVAAAFLILPASRIYKAAVHQWKFTQAKNLFEERCKAAGEKITQQINGVDGIVLLKVRTNSSGEGQYDSNALREVYGDDYIRSFLQYARPEDGSGSADLVFDNTKTTRPGFSYVETIVSVSGKRYRYSLGPNLSLKREEARGPSPRYAVDFEEPMIAEDREHWIASDVIKVIDLTTQAVVAESKRYVLDPGLGSRAGQRTPWLFAKGCGLNTRYSPYGTRFFVEKILSR